MQQVAGSIARPLRVLIVEDSPDDAELMLLELRRGGFDPSWRRVENAEETRAALAQGPWDVALWDYSLPGFDARTALALLRQTAEELPIIVVTGTIGEEQAVDLMKAGADDFLLKGRLARLAPAVERTLREAADREARRAAEQDAYRLAAIVQSSEDAIIGTTPDGTITSWNPAAERLFGYSAAEVVGRSIDLLVPSGLRAENRETTDRVRRGEHILSLGTVRLGKGDRPVHVSITLSTIRDEVGIAALSGIYRDVTREREAEEALRQVTTRVELALRGSDIGVWELELPDGTFSNGRVVFTNVWEQLGYGRPESPPGFTAGIALGHPDDLASQEEAFRAYLADETGQLEFEHRLRHRDGSYRTMLVRGVAVRGATGKPTRVIGSRIDITERKRLEESLRRSEVLLAEAQELAHVGSWNWDLTTDLLTWSDEHYRIFGLERQEDPMTFERGISVIHPDDLPRVRRTVDEALREHKPYDCSLRLLRHDGSVRFVHSRGRAVSDHNGQPIRMYGTVQDVTERKQSEEALRESEARFRGTFENAGVGIGHMDRTYRYVRVNQRFCEIVGHGREELRDATCLQITHPDDMKLGVDQFDTLMRGELQSFSLEKRYLRMDGSPVWVNTSVSLQRDAAGNPAYAIEVIQDISDRKHAEETVRVANEQLDLAIRGSNIGVWDVDLAPGGDYRHGPVRFLNVWEPLGYDPAEFPTDASASRALGHPDDLARVDGAVAACLAGEAEEIRVENRIRHKDGSYHWLLTLGKVMRDESGRPVRLIGTVLDITDRKMAEEEIRRARDELDLRVGERTAELSDALASLEQQEEVRKELLRRIVTVQEEERRRISRELHDQMGQHLTVLMLRLRLVNASVDEDSPLREQLLWLEEYTARIGQEVHRLALELRPTSLDDLGLPAALVNYAEEWSRRSGVAAEVRSSGLEVERLSPHIETAIYRIVQEAMTNVLKHAEARRVIITLNRLKGYVSMMVEDDGKGFDAAKAMDPPESRTRLGLLGMRERAALAGGTLEIESVPGDGMIILVRIPIPAAGEVERHD